ncbi:MAG: class I SAM-dependent methyltransferase [Candidatus Nanoarchaeia archaeon]|jgi:cephalosporin hydroxylase|nr:class I SAM-dependent methyltransferase [Candidatus Nanoarchaeia archaeon]
MKHFYETICSPQQTMFNFQDVYEDAIKQSRQNGILIEVGSWIGQSIAFLAVEAINSQKNLTVISIDAFIGNAHNGNEITTYPQLDLFRKNLEPIWKDLIVIKSLSHLGASYFLDNTIDFVFIDADHSLDAVRRDLNCWWPKICVGGTMAGHDFSHPPVKQAIDEFCEKLNKKYIVRGNCWVLRKD